MSFSGGRCAGGGHLLDRLVDLGYAAGGQDDRAIKLWSYDHSVGGLPRASGCWTPSKYDRALKLIEATGDEVSRPAAEGQPVRYGRSPASPSVSHPQLGA